MPNAHGVIQDLIENQIYEQMEKALVKETSLSGK
jgi:hypothetical protein